MIEIIDFNDCEMSDRAGSYGGNAGYKDGIIFNGKNWMIKYPKTTRGMTRVDISYTTSPLSEYLGSHIYEILGFDVHKTLLGIKNGKLVVACQDFCEVEGSLREIRTLRNYVDKNLAETLEASFSSEEDNHQIDIEEVQLHLKYNPILSNVSGARERFWDQVVIDTLIKNNDRNYGNWGIIKKDRTYVLAPVFDNGASFSPKLSNVQMERIMNDENIAMQSTERVNSIYSMGGKVLLTKDIMQLDIPELKKALLRNIPNIISKDSEIKELFKSVPREYDGIEILSDIRCDFYLFTMQRILDRILIPAYQKIRDQGIYVDMSVKKQSPERKSGRAR